MSADIVRRSPSDDAELFGIYDTIFGAPATAASRARWSWQYEHNPAAPEGPAVWVARESGHAVGQMGTMPVVLWWEGREVRGSWGMDYFVRPDLEGRGHGVQLVRQWTAGVDVALALGLTPTAHAIYRRLGFRDLGRVGFFQTVLDPVAITRRRVGKLPAILASPILRAGAAMWKLRRPKVDGAVRVIPAGAIGPEYDRLWEKARVGFAACVRRDATYVQWKYRDVPHRRYDVTEARAGSELRGFAVTRVEDYRDVRLGWLVDLFASVDDRPARLALLDHVLHGFERAGVARAQALCTSVAVEEDLRRFGFFPGRSQSLLCARASGLPSGPFGRPGDWHVVFGDGDIDR